MTTNRSNLLGQSMQADYRTFSSEDLQHVKVNTTQHVSSTSRCMDFWIRLWSAVVFKATLAILITFIIAFFKDTGFDYDHNQSSKITNNMCSVHVSDSNLRLFEDLVVDNEYHFLYVKLETSHKATAINNTAVYEPKEWVWTFGNSVILQSPEGYATLSFGILDLHTKRHVKMRIDLSPPDCYFEWGERSSTIAVGKALLNFTRHFFPKQKTLQQSKWCYSVKLRNVTKNPILEQDFSFFVQELGYKCCHFHRNESGEFHSKCEDSVAVERVWSIIPFIFSLVSFMYSTNFFVFLYQFFSFKSHVCWVYNPYQTECSEDDSQKNNKTSSEWIYSDYKSPITFLSFVQNLIHFCQRCSTQQDLDATAVSEDACSITRFLKHVAQAILLVFLSLSVILLSLLLYMSDDFSYHLLEQEIKNGIPIGFFALLFPYEVNRDNFMFQFNGSFVFISMYGLLVTLYVLIFKHREPMLAVNNNDTGNFTLNVDLVDKYGRVKCNVNNRYGIFETIHANSRAILRAGFWKELFGRLLFGECVVAYSCQGVRLLVKVLKLFILPASILFSVCVHLMPVLFASLFIFFECIHRSRRKWFVDYLLIVFLSAVHLYLVFSITVIFFGSASFIFLLFSFCIMSIVIFPGAASGIFIYVLAGIYYTVGRFRRVAKKYALYRDLVISVSQELRDKCKGVEARLSVDRDKLLIAGVDVYDVKCIAVVDSCQYPCSYESAQIPIHCHLKDQTLKIIANIELSSLKYISMNGLYARLDDQHTVTFHNPRPHEVKVLQIKESNLDGRNAAYISEEDDTCYVTYRNGLPGIPFELMTSVEKDYLPISTERIRAIIWTLAAACFIAWVTLLIKQFSQWEHLSTVVNALMVVIVVKMSDVARMFSEDVDEIQKLKILKGKLRLSVLKYWMLLRNVQQLNSDATNGVMAV